MSSPGQDLPQPAPSSPSGGGDATQNQASSGQTVSPGAPDVSLAPVGSTFHWEPLVIGVAITLIGGMFVFWWQGRQGDMEQLSRLAKQSKKMKDRQAADEPEQGDLFIKENSDPFMALLSQAGLESRYEKMKQNRLIAMIGIAILIMVACLFSGSAALAPVGVILGPALGGFGFNFYIKYLAKARQDKMQAQLPQVLEAMVSTLKAGSPVVECWKLTAETAPFPIKDEFRRALVSLQLGKPFKEVMAEMSTRIRTPDFKLLTQAIFISQDVGANLADVVAVIADAIRERFKLRDYMAALTAQGKMTALFIGCLPYFITAMTWLMAPSYIGPFLNNPIARIIMILLIIWEGIGAYILVKMTTFEV